MDACIGHDRAGRNRIHILLHDPLDQHAGCHRIYRPGAARPAAGILKDENADQPPSATNWIFGTTREVFDEAFDGFSRIVIQVITSSYAFPASINANYILAAVPDGLTDPQSDFANNLLASSCDSRRPTICFGNSPLRLHHHQPGRRYGRRCTCSRWSG